MIPDAIDPYIGWKALTLHPDGTLHSPSYTTSWPARQPLEAICIGGDHSYYRWNTTNTPPDPTNEELEISFNVATTAFAYRTPSGDWRSDPPKIELPPGTYWTLEAHHDTIVAESCHCGIHAVDDPDQAAYYLDINDNNVLVQIAMWGRLIRGSQGARGQYAYPQQIIIPEHLRERAEQTHHNYDIPIIIDTTPKPRPKPNKTHSKYLKPSFAQILLLLSLAMLTLILSSPLALGLEALPLMLTAPLFFWLITSIIKDWDTLS